MRFRGIGSDRGKSGGKTMQRNFFVCLLTVAVVLCGVGAQAQFAKGDPAPMIKAKDLNGKDVDLDKIIAEGRAFVMLFFFTTQTGEDMAVKLGKIHTAYGGKNLDIIALGLQEEQQALRDFAQNLKISYYVIDKTAIGNAEWLAKINTLPLTLFVVTQTKTIGKIVAGGGSTQAMLLESVAETFFQQGKTAEATAVADQAIAAGEDPKAATEIKGYSLAAEGKLDAAESEFGKINSTAGLAKVAYDKGDFAKAAEVADKAPDDAYAQTVKGEALLKSGKPEEAAASLNKASTSPGGTDWQQSELANTQGRVVHQAGNTDGASANYQKAIALDPYNVVALSNEGAAQREKGNLEGAKASLERATSIRTDDMTNVLLKQVKDELEKSNDTKRGELIRAQITELKDRFTQMKAAGTLAADQWSSRPLVLAFLPSRNQSGVFFERAGAEVVLQREIETKLQADTRCGIVERSMLDKLLQELNLGSSELATADTQKRLGNVLSASLLGFIEYAQSAAGLSMYVRLVDTETTSIVMQASQPVDEKNPSAVAEAVATKILAEAVDGRELKGLIADATDENAIMINLGRKYGVKQGQAFIALQDGQPVQVGGRVIAKKQEPAAKLVVTSVEDDYAICKLEKKVEGAKLVKEMKIKSSK